MDVSITALNKAERRLEIVLAGAPEPPEAFTVVHGDTALARSTAIVSGQAPGGGLSISCEVLADVAAEMVLPAFSTARYGARFPGGEAVEASLTVDSLALLEKLSPKRVIWTRDDLILGKDGFVFFRNGANRLIDQHQGLLRLSPDAERQWMANLERRAGLGRDLGIPLLTVVIPNKETVYSDLIPDFPISDQRPVRRLAALADAAGLSPAFIALEDGLRRLAQEESGALYDRTTAYWNGLGACLAFNLLAPRLSELLSVDIPAYDRSELYYVPRLVLSDWGGVYEPYVFEDRVNSALRHYSSRVAFDNVVPNRGHCRIYRNPDRSKRALLFCDSFTFNVWWQFFAERFGSVVLAHQTAMDPRLIELVRPDLVVNAVVERFLISPPDDASAAPFASLPEALGKGDGADLAAEIRRALA